MNNTITFIYKDKKVEIQCQDKDKMGDIFKKFVNKVDKVNSNFYFIYKGNKVDENLKVEQTASNDDKNAKKMEILAFIDDDHIEISFDENKNKIIANIIYMGKITKIEFEPEAKMGVIYKTFSEKNSVDINLLYFLYKERIIIQKAGIKEFLNYDGKKRKQIKIFITSKNDELIKTKSKQVICPICGELAQIKIKNYKIFIYKCKYRHKIKDLNINEFETSQLINESKIMCDKCKDTNKENTFNHLFYICNTCNLNLCPLCKMNHDKTHNIIDYNNKYFKCDMHDEMYNMYCETCNKNICILCEQDHEDHDIIRLGKLIMKKKDFENKIKKFKISLDKFKEDTKRIINILETVLDNCESFYKISEEFISNFDMKNINYHNLKNFKEFYNDDISKKLDNINSSKNYMQKIAKINEIYNLMNNNKLDISGKSGDTKKLINGLNSKKLNPGEKMMRVIFISEDEKIQYALICKNTDKFNDIGKKFYEMYPYYFNANNYFSVNGRTIDESKDLDYNKIKNGDIIKIHCNKLKKYLNIFFK